MNKTWKIVLTGLLAGVALVLWGGCKGTADVPVVVGPAGYEPLESQAEKPFAVEFPGRTGFAIHNKSSGQAPGPAGSAQGAAEAEADGTASCRAAAGAGGSAWGGFVLGPALVNESDEPLAVAVTCDLEYEYAIQAGARAGGRKTAAKLALRLEARERTTGKVLFSQPLADLSRYEGDVQWSGQQRVQFDAVISPKATLKISSCRMFVAERARSTGPK